MNPWYAQPSAPRRLMNSRGFAEPMPSFGPSTNVRNRCTIVVWEPCSSRSSINRCRILEATMPLPRSMHGARLLHEPFVDVLVRLVRVDDTLVVALARAVLLQVRQEAQPGVSHREMDEPGSIDDALGRRRSGGRSEDGEVAAAEPAPDHPHQAVRHHLEVADPGSFSFEDSKTWPAFGVQ